MRYLLSGLVLTLLVWQLYQLSQEIDAKAFKNGVLQPENTMLIILVLLLMPLNWLLESLKWAILLRPFHDWPFGRIVKAVLAGVSVSAVTPNRIGEIGGRLLKAQKEEFAGVVSSSLLGAICQWVVFLFIGGPALLWIVLPSLSIEPRWFYLGVGIGSILILLLLRFGRLWLKQLLSWLSIQFSLDIGATIRGIKDISAIILFKATLLAALRFFIYVIQLYLLLSVFGVSLPFWYGLAGIASIYLLQAGLPLPPGINLVTRAQLGILLWGNDPVVVTGSLAAFSSLFVVNVLLPSLLTHWLLVKKT